MAGLVVVKMEYSTKNESTLNRLKIIRNQSTATQGLLKALQVNEKEEIGEEFVEENIQNIDAEDIRKDYLSSY